jgi:hypothetical protein
MEDRTIKYAAAGALLALLLCSGKSQAFNAWFTVARFDEQTNWAPDLRQWQDAASFREARMPTPQKSFSDRDIASTALESWDANAEDSEDERELSETVARELIEMGVPEDRAASAAQLAGKAFNVQRFPGKAIDSALKKDPLFQAMLAELRKGGYDNPSGFFDGD